MAAPRGGIRALAAAALVVHLGWGLLEADVGYELLVTGAGADVPRTCYRIPALPGSARGAFFISGPAKFEMGGYRFRSFFDGFGRANRFELGGGELCFTAAFLNTSYLLHAEKLGRLCNGPTFYGTEPALPPCPLKDSLCFITGAQKDNNWVNLMPAAGAGEGLLLTDSPLFLRFDYETLAVRGVYPWKDGGMLPSWLKKFHFPATGSAHPVLRPGTASTWVEIMLEIRALPVKSNLVAVYTIDSATMERALLAHVPVKGAMYFHSFGVSQNYAVLPCNLKMGMPTSTALISAFEDGWDGIHVVDLRTGAVQVFDTESFYHVHVVNTFENETGIVMDVGTFSEIPFSAHELGTAEFLNKTVRDNRTNGTNNVERMHLHLGGPLRGQVTREILSPPGRQTDFFKVSPLKTGLPYCIYYAVEWFHDDRAYASMAILKHDICRGHRSYWARRHSYPSEPLFIPAGPATGAEDDGILVFVTLDGPRGASDFVVLDAKTFKELAVVQLPVHIPFLAHGQFIPAAAQQAVKAALEAESPELAGAIEAAITV